MEAIIYLIPIALFLGFFWLGSFLWSLKNNQFQDLEDQKYRIFFDNDKDDDIDKKN